MNLEVLCSHGASRLGGLADLGEVEHPVSAHAHDPLVRDGLELWLNHAPGHVHVPASVRVAETLKVCPPAIEDHSNREQDARLELRRVTLSREVDEEPVAVIFLQDVDIHEVEPCRLEVQEDPRERERVTLRLFVSEHEPARVRKRCTLAVGASEPVRVAADLLGLGDVTFLHPLRVLRTTVARAYAERLQLVCTGLEHEIQRQSHARVDQALHLISPYENASLSGHCAHLWAGDTVHLNCIVDNKYIIKMGFCQEPSKIISLNLATI